MGKPKRFMAVASKRNKEKDKIWQAKWNAENPEALKIIKKRWKQNNKEAVLIQQRRRWRERMQSDPCYRAKVAIKNRFTSLIHRTTKELKMSGNVQEIIGCDLDFFKKHLESQFKPGMTWGNHGRASNSEMRWQMDHIKPCALFDLTSPEEQKKCFHWTNFQPLWAIENMKKSSKYNETQT